MLKILPSYQCLALLTHTCCTGTKSPKPRLRALTLTDERPKLLFQTPVLHSPRPSEVASVTADSAQDSSNSPNAIAFQQLKLEVVTEHNSEEECIPLHSNREVLPQTSVAEPTIEEQNTHSFEQQARTKLTHPSDPVPSVPAPFGRSLSRISDMLFRRRSSQDREVQAQQAVRREGAKHARGSSESPDAVELRAMCDELLRCGSHRSLSWFDVAHVFHVVMFGLFV